MPTMSHADISAKLRKHVECLQLHACKSPLLCVLPCRIVNYWTFQCSSFLDSVAGVLTKINKTNPKRYCIGFPNSAALTQTPNLLTGHLFFLKQPAAPGPRSSESEHSHARFFGRWLFLHACDVFGTWTCQCSSCLGSKADILAKATTNQKGNYIARSR